MSIYAMIDQAMRDKDADAYLNLLHDKYEFVRHQSGTRMNKAGIADLIRGMMASDAMKVGNERCIYENDEILVEHSVMDFPDGTRETVMGVHVLKDGKILRSGTGATLIKN
jgi:hypothetical protein